MTRGIDSKELMTWIEETGEDADVLLVATDARSEYLTDTLVWRGSLEGDNEDAKWETYALKSFLEKAKESDSPSITAICCPKKKRTSLRWTVFTRHGAKWEHPRKKLAKEHLADALAATGLWWIRPMLRYERG